MAPMDWWKLLTLLVAVASVQVKADGPKKKIRIHLPHMVKHIHHHKKIYITNHPATSQYAPAFMPSAEGAVAVPTNIALPAVPSIMPLNSVDLLEDSLRAPGLTASASKLLPLYRARGYYGPTHSELEDQDVELAPIAEPADSYIVPTSVLTTSPDSNHNPPKRVKVVKVSDPSRKKIIRKVKPRRAPVRKPIVSVQQEEEHPVSTFHEQFYSDIQDAGTIRKIKKPPRVEKIVDGNTEHIHTYSEEHIHKVVYDDEPKYTSSVIGVEPIGALPAYAHSFIPIKNGQVLAMASDPYRTVVVPGSMGTPAEYEYAAYNPGEVTHDHYFHDHGEIPEDIDLTKDLINLPPKVSYNSHGLRIGSGLPKRFKSQYIQRSTKAPPVDYSYYENIYSSSRVKPTKATAPLPLYVSPQNDNINDFKPKSTYRYKDGISSKNHNKIPTYYGKPSPDYRLKKPSNVPTPFSVSSKIVHDYKPAQQTYSGALPGSNIVSLYEDPFASFKDSNANNFDYDNYASSSNVHRSEDKNHHSTMFTNQERKGRKKSISTQNLRFGSQNSNKYSDTLPKDNILTVENDGMPSALENVDSYGHSSVFDNVTPTSYITKDSSSPYQYYSVMAVKALSDDQLSMPAASNDNYQYAEAPTSTPNQYVVTTTVATPQFLTNKNEAETTTQSTEFVEDTRYNKRFSENDLKNVINAPSSERLRGLKEMKATDNIYKPRLHSNEKHSFNVIFSPTTERSKVRYGDKI